MQGLLAELEQQLETTDYDTCSDDVLRSLVSSVFAGRRVLEGHLAAICGAAREREQAGDGPPAEDLLRRGGEVSAAEAKRLALRALLAEHLPQVAAALCEGKTRPENADVVAAAIDKLSGAERARLAVFDGEIAQRASTEPPETFRRWFNRLRRNLRDRHHSDGEQPSDAEQAKSDAEFGMRRRADGSWDLFGRFDAERGAAIDAAVRGEARRLAGDGDITAATRADALYRLLLSCGEGPAARLGIGYIVDAATLLNGEHDASVAETWGGHDCDPAAVQRLACDATWYAVLLDRLGTPTAVGRTRHAATRDQRLQLRALYACCPLDGTPFDQCEIHHVNVSFANHGHAELDNLLPISTHWHHRIHDRGWQLTMNPDRSLELRRPNGQLERTIPPPAPITRRE